MERRRFAREASLNMIAYTGIDGNNDEVAGRIGRTLNISECGILLETHVPLAPQSSIFLEIGLGEDIVKVTGIVVFCRAGHGNFFEAGIDFIDCSGDKDSILRKYIDNFRKMQKNHQ
jgi:hypothetical protein